MTIRMLTPETIGKIAAGEVIERPASVVKELLENALDAGAGRIAIAIAGGGSDLIEVVDDGHGMSTEEIPLALTRHATSKLAAFEDLDLLRTLGFRGEALPSVAAVSRLTLRSRQPGERSGSRIDVDFGESSPVVPDATSPGTTVTVRDLFANIPARRKFLRQPSTETGYAVRVVEAYAAAYPAIAFSLTVDGRSAFSTPGDGDAIAAAAAIHGATTGSVLLAIPEPDEDAIVPGIRVSGWVGGPTVSKSHRQGIVLFVNGRWIQSRPLGYALEEAYHTLLMVGRHPIATLSIEVDPASIDANVHPTKAEVKFADERAVARAVQRATHAALAAVPRDILPHITWEPSIGSGEAVRPQSFLAPDRFATPQPVPAPPPGSSGIILPPQRQLPVLRVLGQVGSSYIIAEGPEGVYLIDQHAAHERILYERILRQLADQGVDRQPLLDPVVVELTPEEMAVFARSAEELASIGFDCEVFGDGAIAVRSIPAALPGGDLANRFRQILDELADGGVGTSWLDSVAISAACHTSIRANQPLSLPEMRELIEQLEATEHPRACGHGRPTMIKITQDELERQFSRR